MTIRKRTLPLEGAMVEVNRRDVVIHTADGATVLTEEQVGWVLQRLIEWSFQRIVDRRGSPPTAPVKHGGRRR